MWGTLSKSAIICLIAVVVHLTTTVSARPTTQLLSREKRQSDQRLAELETLLALQKYGRHRMRMDRKKGAGGDGEHPPGYGLIDFHLLGRKKKSTRFSPGELENLRRQISLASGNGRETVKENQPLRNWSSNNDFITNGDPTFTEDPPVSLEQHEERVVRSMDDIEDLTDSGDVPLYYLRNK